MRRRTSSRTSSGAPVVKTPCVSTSPPQKVMSLPKSRLSADDSMPTALTCTGLMMSMPISIMSGMISRMAPHEWKKILASLRALIKSMIFLWRGLMILR